MVTCPPPPPLHQGLSCKRTSGVLSGKHTHQGMLILHLPITHWERPRTLEGGLDFVVFCWRKRRQRAKYGMFLSSFNHYNPNMIVFLRLLPTRLKREVEQPPTQHSHLSRSGRHPKSQKVENAAWVGVCACVYVCVYSHACAPLCTYTCTKHYGSRFKDGSLESLR